ncbi:hypothetical protein [Dolichospermum flos-aquae]|uniref:Uncharacterized protein n=1 Tax=Dolichospermum flos-aquae LEGE 04289 TaxID=1828708 RepID=A0ACC5Q3R4_DOLFA|nr:hypothetical protein [Dolichospermum flos-aquae]MBE9219262.1 hypothetical protein [Dolichospermum flos-aquae LEGE 04289]
MILLVLWDGREKMILLVLWDGHLARPVHPTRFILIFLDFWADRMSTPQDFDFPGFLGGQDVHPTRFILIFLDFWADRMSTPQDLF